MFSWFNMFKLIIFSVLLLVISCLFKYNKGFHCAVLLNEEVRAKRDVTLPPADGKLYLQCTCSVPKKETCKKVVMKR